MAVHDWGLRLTRNDFADEVEATIHSTARERARRGLPPLSVITIDHYNVKWALHAIEFALRWHLAQHILEHPSRIVIEAYEEGILPRGRFTFYNGVSGAIADMLSHLVQPLRALLRQRGVAGVLGSLRVRRVDRARYELDPQLLEPRPNPFQGEYSSQVARQRLFEDTETAGRIVCELTSGPWTGVEVEIATGKGCPARKLVRVERDRQAVVFDFGGNQILLREVRPSGQEVVVMTAVPEVGIKPDAQDYVQIFSTLCAWEPPDPRFFPPVSEAAELHEWQRQLLVLDRFKGPITITYERGHFPKWPSA